MANPTYLGSFVGGSVPNGTARYADSTVTASGVGTSWATAYKTIAEAVAGATAGDTIFMRGSFTEGVTIATASLNLVGCGTSPRDAVYWNPAAGNDKVNLTINAAYTKVQNVYFRPGAQSATYSACIVLGTGASHTRIVGNRFQGTTGAYYAIYSPATGADNVHIVGNQFMYFNTATYGSAILTAQASPWNAYSGWHIEDNEFNSCVIAIDMQARVCRIIGNTINVTGVAANASIGTVCTTGINLTGNGAECNGNVVSRNVLGGAYTTALYNSANSGDVWIGNYVAKTTTTGDYGLSVAVPAA